MAQIKTESPADALISVLRLSLNTDGGQPFGYLVLYTSFGVVRGRTSLSLAAELAGRSNGETGEPTAGDVIELHDVTVEHYSNHLANAGFDRLFVRLSEVRGFALVKPPQS
ncbi:MAG TPA: hypothetical protein VJH03_16810 [Blastocatellia bacterium]|nr:hypothetical protein [Blastocatellia bacterium]